ncbi:protein kinase-like protein [Herbihabitans rhizosphaerae]|uniref:Protein kinase-like protein n=1 Tax=Herbihabitans rhizosphaerae TaxID=1872711 RepID=A0A4Q7L4I7_9PSEU|nr:serine/threonine-protein kinase [Herbihabitans rhizosphaerae]RZS44177.1 protein kinase-like protein [Herbihabitans rhizosphaerae]
MPEDRIVAGRYRLHDRIGAGGMGSVWRATDQELGRVVALKRSHAGDNGQIRREARIGAGLHHPNVITTFDVVSDGEDRWLVLEFLPSRSLATVVETGGPLSPDAAASVGAQIAGALAAMHERGIVHQDIKPDNILVTEDGTAKLTDLGIARWAEVTITSSGHPGGTPGFVAPEVADGYAPEASADVFSLGATLYAAVEGHSPWGTGADGPYAQLRRAAEGTVDATSRAGVLEPVLAELLGKDPAVRPTARGAKTLLEEITGESSSLVPLPTPRRRSRRSRVLAGIVGVALIAVIALVAVLVSRNSDSTAAGPPATADLLGNERTADPCSLFERSALVRFGIQVYEEPVDGEFNTCRLIIKETQDNSDLVGVKIELARAPKYPVAKHVPGELGPVQYDEQRDDMCKRTIPLPDGKEVVIVSYLFPNNRSAPLCGIADAASSPAYLKLVDARQKGQIPRRAVAFPGDSFANITTCDLLRSDELAPVVGRHDDGESTFGDWSCEWDGPQANVEIRAFRDWQPDADEQIEKIRLGAREAEVESHTAGPGAGERDECEIQIIGRKYEQNTVVNDDWQEEIGVSVKPDVKGAMNREKLCGIAKDLAKRVADRLR